MKLNTFRTIKESSKGILGGVNLSDQFCGLFRCPLLKASQELPEFWELYHEAIFMLTGQGHNPAEWEMDLKIHMLMKDQYPCIPNWHCDNVPRIDGDTRYDLIEEDAKPMYLWLSDNPTTEFLDIDFDAKSFCPPSHGELSKWVSMARDWNKVSTLKVPAKTWVSIDQRTPHRGTKAQENTWRVFVRLTHKSITPVRPVNNYIRRHCQVYLDPKTFSW